MLNEEIREKNTGSLPKGMQFLEHGTPGPMPEQSEAELERAEQTAYNLFTEDDYSEPAASADADSGFSYGPGEPARAPVGDLTASIAGIIASVFESAASPAPKAAAPGQTSSIPVVLDTADASRPLPSVDASAYTGAAYESGVLPRTAPEAAVQESFTGPVYTGPEEYADPGYGPEQGNPEGYYGPEQGYQEPYYEPQQGFSEPGYDPAYAEPAYGTDGTYHPAPRQAQRTPAAPGAKPAAGSANRTNTGKTAKAGKNAKAGKTAKAGKAAKAAKPAKPGNARNPGAQKAQIGRDAARIAKNSAPAAGAPVLRPGTNYVNIADSGIRDSASIRTMLQDIRDRQEDALPSETVSVRSSMKTIEARTRMGRMLNPVRYVIILLMVLCLAGRKIEWMTLGFMSGYPGTKFSIFVTAVSMLVSWRAAKKSVRDLAFLRAGYETWLLIATILTASEAVLHDNARSLMPLLAIAWSFAGIADYRNDRVQIRADKAMTKAKQRTGLRMKAVSAGREQSKIGIKTFFTKAGRAELGKRIAGSQKNRSLIGKAKASTTGFVRHQESPDPFHRLWTAAAPILFVLLLILAAYISGRTGKLYLTTLVLLMDMATPVTLTLCCVRPYELFTANTRRHGAVAGWFGMQQLSGNRSMLLYDTDFYPSGTIEKKDIRLYAHMDIRTFVSYAACLGIKGKIGYDELFISMMREYNGSEVDVYAVKILQNGVQGRIHNESVFIGSYEFMRLEGFNPPQQGARDSLYLAVGKKLIGEIMINYRSKHGAPAAFRHLQHEPGLYPMVAARNFLINPGYIGRTFRVNTEKVVCMKAANRRRLAQSATLDESSVCGFVFHEGIVSYSAVTAGARRTYRAGFWMAVLSLTAAVILILRTSLTLLGRYGTPTGIGLIMLNLILFLVIELVSRLAAGNPD